MEINAIVWHIGLNVTQTVVNVKQFYTIMGFVVPFLDCFECTKRSKLNSCDNQAIFMRQKTIIKLSRSLVCDGLGIFNVFPVHRFQCMTTYFGEVVPGDESCRRGKIAEIDGHVYMFALTEEVYSNSFLHFH